MNGAVRSASVAMSPGITAAYNRTQFPVIADIGGGIGTQLAPILDASPASRGILFDKPHLRTDQQEALQNYKSLSRSPLNTLLSEPQSTVARFRKHCENSQPGCKSSGLVSTT
jgi:hypothetical protein